MRKPRYAGLLISAVLCGDIGAHAQEGITAPELERYVGAWALDTVESGATEPERRVITLGPGWMRVEIHRPGDDHPPVLIYNLNGSPNVNPFGSGVATTELRRDRNGIVTVTVFTINDRPVTVQEHLQITSAGDMTVAVLLRVEHGYQGVPPTLEKRGANVSETSKYFRKTR